jgi:hypothetical protein
MEQLVAIYSNIMGKHLDLSCSVIRPLDASNNIAGTFLMQFWAKLDLNATLKISFDSSS